MRLANRKKWKGNKGKKETKGNVSRKREYEKLRKM